MREEREGGGKGRIFLCKEDDMTVNTKPPHPVKTGASSLAKEVR